MKDSLAQELLAKITTDWTIERLTKERKDLQLLSDYKYDEYQQFEPGMRFIERLALWLEQFEPESRNIAYEFIKDNLIFISTAELHHLIRITYPDFIRHYLIEQIAPELGVDEYMHEKIVSDNRFCALERQCLFFGLSDGAQIGVFRRFSALKHEQVHPTYSISEEKANEILCEISEQAPKSGVSKCRFVFLIDDFSASGKSYLRRENGDLTGKIYKFYQQLKEKNTIAKICDENVKICVVLYLATKKATRYIRETASEENIPITVIPIHELNDSVCMIEDDLKDFARLVLEKFDEDYVVTDAYRKGKCDKPHMGFDECGMAVVLSHNCPNNSLPILWSESKLKNTMALFPRFVRHT